MFVLRTSTYIIALVCLVSTNGLVFAANNKRKLDQAKTNQIEKIARTTPVDSTAMTDKQIKATNLTTPTTTLATTTLSLAAMPQVTTLSLVKDESTSLEEIILDMPSDNEETDASLSSDDSISDKETDQEKQPDSGFFARLLGFGNSMPKESSLTIEQFKILMHRIEHAESNLIKTIRKSNQTNQKKIKQTLLQLTAQIQKNQDLIIQKINATDAEIAKLEQQGEKLNASTIEKLQETRATLADALKLSQQEMLLQTTKLEKIATENFTILDTKVTHAAEGIDLANKRIDQDVVPELHTIKDRVQERLIHQKALWRVLGALFCAIMLDRLIIPWNLSKLCIIPLCVMYYITCLIGFAEFADAVPGMMYNHYKSLLVENTPSHVHQDQTIQTPKVTPEEEVKQLVQVQTLQQPEAPTTNSKAPEQENQELPENIV